MRLRAPADPTRCFLVAYDIADDRRRAQVVRVLLRVANRIQFSVFEARLDEAQLMALVGALDRVIDARADRVDLVEICGRCSAQRRRLGAAVPEARPFGVW